MPGAITRTSARRLPEKPHALEAQVHRELLADTHLDFSSLVIRRIPNGVCLQGVVEVDQPEADVSSCAMRVRGVASVQNRLVVRHKAK
ncbi:MAG: BON domain-containing protein [Fuerstiella sp.]|nr:BON domain-containing protein [Fuerstiella sp.]